MGDEMGSYVLRPSRKLSACDGAEECALSATVLPEQEITPAGFEAEAALLVRVARCLVHGPVSRRLQKLLVSCLKLVRGHIAEQHRDHE